MALSSGLFAKNAIGKSYKRDSMGMRQLTGFDR
jgi:hypothetical protein